MRSQQRLCVVKELTEVLDLQVLVVDQTLQLFFWVISFVFEGVAEVSVLMGESRIELNEVDLMLEYRSESIDHSLLIHTLSLWSPIS